MICKITGKKIKPFMSFGKMPSANGFLDEKDFSKEFFYEMEVGFSEKISLLQLNEFSNPKKIHNEKYPFYTSSSKYMENHFKIFSEWMQKLFLNSNSKLIEIGSNDGTLLKNFNNTHDFDIFYAISHGVHRGNLRQGKSDEREIFISKLKKKPRM